MSYEERLAKLQMFPIQYRHERGELIAVYNVISGHWGRELASRFEFDRRSNRRGHGWKLKTRRLQRVRQELVFAARSIGKWNALPDDVVDAPTVASFKARLDRSRMEKMDATSTGR